MDVAFAEPVTTQLATTVVIPNIVVYSGDEMSFDLEPPPPPKPKEAKTEPVRSASSKRRNRIDHEGKTSRAASCSPISSNLEDRSRYQADKEASQEYWLEAE